MKTKCIVSAIFLAISTLILAQTNVCFGDTVNYSVDDTDGTSGTAGSTYAWSITTAGFSGSLNSSGAPTDTNDVDVDWASTPAGTYTLQVIETSADGCVGTPITHNITVIDLPTAPTVASVAGSVCSGEDAQFTISGTPNATVTFTINGGAPITVTLDGSGNYTHTETGITSNTVIVITEIDNGNCTLSAISGVTATVSIYAAPSTSAITAN